MKRLGWVLLGAVVAGCAAHDDAAEQPKVEDFAVLPVTTYSSVLPAIEDSEGQPDICIGLIGYAPAESSGIYEQLTSQLTDAMNKWNALLDGQPLWRFHGTLQPNYRLQMSECTQTIYTGFSVNLWKDVARFKSEFCTKNRTPETSCASAAYPNRRIFYMGPWNRTREDYPLDGFTVLHEYGHLLGLGDTYRTAGVNDWNGEQPDAVMNGQSYTLTDDDRLGLIATLRAVKTGYRSCDGIAAEAQFTVNGFDAILCNPKTIPVTAHEGRAADTTIPAPPTGPIPDSTLRETQDYTVAALQLNCRSGAGTENAIVTKLDQNTPLRNAGRIAYSTEGKPWLLVYANGSTCYASASLSFITPQGPIPMSTINEVNDFAVSTQLLNCRSGAGTEFGPVQQLPLGTKLTIASDERVRYSSDGNPWIHVEANGLSCFSSANFKFVVPQL